MGAMQTSLAGQAASAPFARADETIRQQMLAVNLTGTFHCTQEALPDMLSAKWGRVVNVASTAGLAAGIRRDEWTGAGGGRRRSHVTASGCEFI
jgi:short-subunit dehydrogenase